MKNAPTTKSNESAKDQKQYNICNTAKDGKKPINPQTKKARILELLQKRSLNRFEAERYGDHCLNSTISSLKKDGHIIHGVTEKVPTRFGKPVPVKRYFLVKGASND
jgi:hypothetical protein